MAYVVNFMNGDSVVLPAEMLDAILCDPNNGKNIVSYSRIMEISNDNFCVLS